MNIIKKTITANRLKIFIFFSVLILLFVFVADTGLAKELENNYPKIPIPTFGNFSLNEIFQAISDGSGPAADKFNKEDAVTSLVLYFYSFSVVIVGIVAFGAVVVAGIKFLASGANPALRREATEQLRAVIMGILILLGSWLLLNTINPELVILHTPGTASQDIGKIGQFDNIGLPTEPNAFDVDIDLETLKYGGVIVFEDLNTSGSSGKSEVIFHNVEDFSKASFISANNEISAIKILGDCRVQLKKDDGMTSGPPIDGPTSGTLTSLGLQGNDNNVKSLAFDPLGGRSCLGHSVKVYESVNYNVDAESGFNAEGPDELAGNSTDGTRLFIHNNFDLRGVDFVADGNDVDNHVRSLRFARVDDPEFSVLLHEEPGGVGENITLLNNAPTISAIVPDLQNKVSSITLLSARDRQAGVVLYEHPNFKQGRQEIFIASDRNLSNGSFLQHDKLSSLKIIGSYRVTLYEDNNFEGKRVQIDNSDPQAPTFETVYNLSGGPPGVKIGTLPADFRLNNILHIPDLRDKSMFCIQYKDPDNPSPKTCEKTFNDKLNSIKIELPQEVYDKAFFPGTCPTRFCEL